ncbi:MAG TPA: alpha-ribazole phosphatase [Prolixibacteraceae bacterium]|nr:alpha-ribazole phosphatase [Prolixibacteraceae bacterium]
MKQFKLTLIRHTTVDVPPGMIYGQTDVPLNASFNDEAAMVIEQIAPITFDAVYSSPLSRCMQLAQKISPKVIPDNRLMELNFGYWETKFWADVYQTPEAKAWFADYVNTPAPGGESYAQLIQRCEVFLEEIKKTKHNNICIVTHGGSIRAIKSIIQNIPPMQSFKTKINYSEISCLEHNFIYEKRI